MNPKAVTSSMNSSREPDGEDGSVVDRVSPLPEVSVPPVTADDDGLGLAEALGVEEEMEGEMEEVAADSWWTRSWAWVKTKVRLTPAEREAAKFVVEEKTAMRLAAWPFNVLAAYDHPAWALTEEEAREVAPVIAEAVEKVIDRYLPESLAYLKAKNPELFAVVVVFGKLSLVKAGQVRKVKLEEARHAAQAPGDDAAA